MYVAFIIAFLAILSVIVFSVAKALHTFKKILAEDEASSETDKIDKT